MFVLARKSKRTARSCNKSGSTVLDYPKTPGPCHYHKQDWYFPVPLHTQNPAGLPGFQANFFSRKRACHLLERANAEGEFLFFRRRLTGFTVVRPATWLCLEYWETTR